MGPSIKKMIDEFGVENETLAFLDADHTPFINGRFVPRNSGKTDVVIEPCTGEELASVQQATPEDVDDAVQAAGDTPWPDITPMEREAVIHKIADLMERDFQILAEIESLNAGKPISGCKPVDVAGSINLLRYMAGWASKIEGATRSVSAEGSHFAYTRKEPVGVVGAIVPWNWPLSMAIWKLAAPLAAGCSIVLKPSELTPLSMLYFARLCQEAGLPDGVINIVTGPGNPVGSHLCSHPGVRKISFTGSTAVGREVGSKASGMISHVTLELGGKSPMLVFDDARVDDVVDATQRSIFFNAGQVCSAGSRMYVHASLYPEVVARVAAKAGAMKLGSSLDPDADMGPVISKVQFDKVLDFIETGRSEGARVVCGGEPVPGNGYYVQPTVFSDCDNGMRIVQEEIFGPVLSIVPFDDKSDVIALANDNAYGLAASVFTRDVSRALSVIEKLDAGTVWVNTHDYVDCAMPFGGFKASGIGKDLGPEQLSHYLETKTVWIKI